MPALFRWLLASTSKISAVWGVFTLDRVFQSSAAMIGRDELDVNNGCAEFSHARNRTFLANARRMFWRTQALVSIHEGEETREFLHSETIELLFYVYLAVSSIKLILFVKDAARTIRRIFSR